MGDVRTWYEALSAATAAILPNDLLAGWILPRRGDPFLLGPEEIAADRLQLPIAVPLIRQEALFALEDTIQRAGFRSVMAVPVPGGTWDAGLLVIGSFAADRYDRGSLRTLHRLADTIAPTCRRLAERPWLPAVPTAHDVGGDGGRLLTALLEAVSVPGPMADVVHLTSDVISIQLPHDHVEVITAIHTPPTWSLLTTITGHEPVDPGVVATRRIEALVQHFGDAPVVRVDDLEEVGLAWPAPPGRVRRGGGTSLIAVRMEVDGVLAGWYCLGNDRPGSFRRADEAVAGLTARMLAPRVATWTARGER